MKGIQLVMTMFLTHPTGEASQYAPISGEQLALTFSWFARIYIDMKKAVGQRIEWLKGFESFKNVSQRELFKRATEWMKGEVEKFQAEFHKSGDVSQCPDYVYFLGE